MRDNNILAGEPAQTINVSALAEQASLGRSLSAVHQQTPLLMSDNNALLDQSPVSVNVREFIAQSDDAGELKIRAGLGQQISNALSELESNLAELRRDDVGDNSLLAQGEAQLGALSALQRQLDGANPFAMAMMRASIAASVAASYNLAQQVRTAAASPAQGVDAAQQLAAASGEARSAVTGFMHDMYERKIFEPYLHFISKEDEDAYRKREAETKRAIEEALKLNTPEGNLRAAELSAAQLKDAGAHGATASPEYQSKMADLTNVSENLRAQIAAPKEQANAAARIAATQSSVSEQAIAVPADVLAALRGLVAANPSDAGHGVTRFEQTQTTVQSRS